MLWQKNWPQQDPLIPPLPSEPAFENIRRQARENPAKVAVNFYGNELTYKRLDDASDRFATGLLNLGVKKGDRVALYLENCPQFVIAFYGILKMGGVVANCSPMYKADELEHELRDAGIETIVLLEHFYPVLGQVRERCGLKNVITTSFADYLPAQPAIPIHPTMSMPNVSVPDAIDFKTLIEKTEVKLPPVAINLEEDIALFQYTAGTTGLPKGAMLSHWNLAVHERCIRHYYQYTEKDIHLVVLPLFHVTGLDIAMNPALAAGGTLILFARFDLLPTLDVIQKYRPTVWVTITPINVAVLNVPGIENYDFSSLRLVLSGGAPVPIEIHKRWYEVTRSNIIEGYGLSEACGGIVGNNQYKFTPGKVGSPLYYHDVKLMDVESGQREVGVGQEGELWVKGPCVMKGYWNAPEQTKDVLRDGWLRTGDIATMDENGVFAIVGRMKEMIKVSGYAVFLAEVDAFLYKHPAVAEAATIGVPHPYRGEEPKSFIVLKPDFKGKVTEEEIIEWCKDKMSAYKHPRQVVFVDSLPKSGSGKILKRLLK